MPLFSVLIPTYNRRERLLRALGSVFAQSFTDYEVIVVDDGSTDGTEEALAAHAERLTLIQQQNLGPAAARNSGARAAKGTYLAFLDSDDQWFPWTLEHLSILVREHENPTLLYSATCVDEREAQTTHATGTAPVADRYSTLLDAMRADGLTLNPSGVALRRDAFDEVGGFSESLYVGEDFDLWFRLMGHPGFVLISSPPSYIREHHDNSLTGDVTRSYLGMLEVLRRERNNEYRDEGEAQYIRRAILTRHLMFYAGEYQRRGERARALRFYAEVLRLQAAARFHEPAFGGRRNRFLLSFPLLILHPGLYDLAQRVLHGSKRVRASS